MQLSGYFLSDFELFGESCLPTLSRFFGKKAWQNTFDDTKARFLLMDLTQLEYYQAQKHDLVTQALSLRRQCLSWEDISHRLGKSPSTIWRLAKKLGRRDEVLEARKVIELNRNVERHALIDEAIALRRKGLRWAEIENKMHYRYDTILHWARKLDRKDEFKNNASPAKKRTDQDILNDMSAQLDYAIALRRKGVTWPQVSERIGRASTTIYKWAKRLGRTDELASAYVFAKAIERRNRYRSLIGKRFGNRVVLRAYQADGEWRLMVECDCGRIYNIADERALRSSVACSGCAHSKRQPVQGERFGHWQFSHRTSEGKGVFTCGLCDQMYERRVSVVLNGYTKRCWDCRGKEGR